MTTSPTKWTSGVEGILLDITGVLYESGSSEAIEGSINAVDKLKEAGLQVRFCSNETTVTRQALVDKLTRLGFTIKTDEVFTPIPAICKILKERQLRPHLLVHPNALPDFAEIDTEDPNCVVLGDAMDGFSYANINKAFQILVALKKPVLFSLGKGRYYKDGDDLVLDVGSYSRALEYACDVEAEVVGKPSDIFFNSAVKDMDLSPDKVLMIGDDVVSDVGGALKCGMRGVLVRTGKYRPTDENHPTVKPSAIVKNLSEAVDILIKSLKPWDGMMDLA